MSKTWITQALAAGGTLTVKAVMPPKPYFVATMSWPGESDIKGNTGLSVDSAMESLETALEDDATKEAIAAGDA